MITYHPKTDLFQLPAGAFCHGINTRGVAGGLAADVFMRFPDMRDVYQSMCQQNALAGGDILPIFYDMGDRKFWVYNLVTQIEPGASASLDLVRQAMANMRSHAEMAEVESINCPLIGAGIGGLRWPDVDSILHEVFDDSPVTLQVCFLSEEVPE